jgi:hypothetical protein
MTTNKILSELTDNQYGHLVALDNLIGSRIVTGITLDRSVGAELVRNDFATRTGDHYKITNKGRAALGSSARYRETRPETRPEAAGQEKTTGRREIADIYMDAYANGDAARQAVCLIAIQGPPHLLSAERCAEWPIDVLEAARGMDITAAEASAKLAKFDR